MKFFLGSFFLLSLPVFFVGPWQGRKPSEPLSKSRELSSLESSQTPQKCIEKKRWRYKCESASHGRCHKDQLITYTHCQ